MPEIKFYKHDPIPMEMHKVKIVQKLNLPPVKQRLEKMKAAGFNTFLLHNGDIFMDMLTDSGVNAMSDEMQSAMLRADDAYAGSETFYRMNDKLTEIFGIKNLLPAHQGRACEHILARHFVKPGSCVIMNYHFTTSKAHVTTLGGHVEELVKDEGLIEKSTLPFKGDIDLDKVKACIEKEGAENIAYLRLEAGTNLIGGMSVKEMEAMTIGFEESMDFDVISQGPQFIIHCVDVLDAYGVPMITPGGGLGAHINAREVVSHIPSEEYPAGSLVAALYICGGIRGMERGTLSEERNPDGSERIASVEMVRLAFPRRVFTLSQTEYVIDRVKWLYDHRELIGGLRFVHEPKTLRFFTGRLEPVSDWPEKLAAAYAADFGDDQ